MFSPPSILSVAEDLTFVKDANSVFMKVRNSFLEREFAFPSRPA